MWLGLESGASTAQGPAKAAKDTGGGDDSFERKKLLGLKGQKTNT